MQVLNECIANGSLTQAIKAIAEAANPQVVGLTAQAATNAGEIDRVLTDCRTFVEQTRVENEASRLKLTQEADALQVRFRDVVQFVDGVPDTVAALQVKLNAVTEWCADKPRDCAGGRPSPSEGARGPDGAGRPEDGTTGQRHQCHPVSVWQRRPRLRNRQRRSRASSERPQRLRPARLQDRGVGQQAYHG